jgi:hypothetical protein
MKQPKFKAGDRVRVHSNRYEGIPATRGAGTICRESSAYGGRWEINLDDGQQLGYRVDEIELLEKTLDNLEVDDVLVNEDGNEKTILGVCGKVYLTSAYKNPNSAGSMYTVQELKDAGYTIKGQTAEPVEMTVAEIAKKLGIPNLHVVDGEDD